MDRRTFLTGLIAVGAGCLTPPGGSTDPESHLAVTLQQATSHDSETPFIETRDGGDELIVGGTAQLPNPCHDLEMGDWSYREGDATLAVKLAAVDNSPDDAACASVIQPVDYTLVIEDPEGVVDTVLVGEMGRSHRLERPDPGGN